MKYNTFESSILTKYDSVSTGILMKNYYYLSSGSASLGVTLLRLRLVKFKNSFRFFTTRAHFFSELSLCSLFLICSLLEADNLSFNSRRFERFDLTGIESVLRHFSVDSVFFLFFVLVKSFSESENASYGELDLKVNILLIQLKPLNA